MPPPKKQSLILVSLVLAGCYVPEPASPAAIAPGERLRVVLSAQGRERVSELSAQQADEVMGRLVRLTEDSLTITTRLRGPMYASSPSGLRQALTIGLRDIQQVTVPQLHRGRTALVVGAVLAAAIVLALDILDFGGDGSSPPNGPPPPPSPLRYRR